MLSASEKRYCPSKLTKKPRKWTKTGATPESTLDAGSKGLRCAAPAPGPFSGSRGQLPFGVSGKKAARRRRMDPFPLLEAQDEAESIPAGLFVNIFIGIPWIGAFAGARWERVRNKAL